MEGFLLRFICFSIFFPYFCSWVFIGLSGNAGIDVVLHVGLLLVLVPTFIAFSFAFKFCRTRKISPPSTRKLRQFTYVLTLLSICFSLFNLYRVFGTLNPVSIVLQNYLSLPLRVVEYKFGGSPIINNLHMLVAFALSLNIYMFVKYSGAERVFFFIFTIICALLTVAIPIKTMLVESLLLPYVFARLAGEKQVSDALFKLAPILFLLIMLLDMGRILSTLDQIDFEGVQMSAAKALEHLSFYFAAGFLNFNLVMQDIGPLGNGTLGSRLFAPLLDIALAAIGAERIIQRGYTGKTLVDGLDLPEIENGVNIYTSLLTFFLDFGYLFVVLVPIFWLIYASIISKLAVLFGRSGHFIIALFLVMVVFSFAWSLKLFYLRFLLWLFVCVVFFSWRGQKYA